MALQKDVIFRGISIENAYHKIYNVRFSDYMTQPIPAIEEVTAVEGTDTTLAVLAVAAVDAIPSMKKYNVSFDVHVKKDVDSDLFETFNHSIQNLNEENLNLPYFYADLKANCERLLDAVDC